MLAVIVIADVGNLFSEIMGKYGMPYFALVYIANVDSLIP